MSGLLDVRALRHSEPQRICIVKPSALGDVVQTLPVLEALRERWPGASICWVIREDLSDLVNNHALVDEWLPFERGKGPRAFARLLRQLRRRRFDLTIDLQGLARSALMTLATGAPIRVGLENSRDAAFLAHNLVLARTGSTVPAHARYWRLAEELGNPPRHPQAHLPISNRARQTADRLLSQLSETVLAVHPGAAWDTKRWPVGRFAAIAARAVRDLGTSIVALGGPAESKLTRRFVANLRAVVPQAMISDLSGRTSVGELAAVLKRVDLLLTNDSGPMHLAAAAETPVVGLFTATDPLLSGPGLSSDLNTSRHELVATPSRCRACYRRRCPMTGGRRNACQRDLQLEHVWQALVRCIGRNQLASATQPTPAQSGLEPSVPLSD
jgi:lipopolysaccharide heptosyltransferase II